MSNATRKRQSMRALLDGPAIGVAPAAIDVLIARLVADAGFPAIYISGSLQHRMRGYADVNVLTMSEMVDTATAMADALDIPCLADGETGFGFGINVRRAVRDYERAGVAAIHIEDSSVPKRPAHLGFDSPTVSRAEFVDKIKTALDARSDESFVIIARSELRDDPNARADRLQEAVEVGADAFWMPTNDLADMRALRARLGKPCVGILPGAMTAAQYEGGGARLGILPGALAVAALLAQKAFLADLRATGSANNWLRAQPGYDEMNTFFTMQGVKDV